MKIVTMSDMNGMKFWHERSPLQSVAVRRSTGNDVVATISAIIFQFFFHSDQKTYLAKVDGSAQ